MKHLARIIMTGGFLAALLVAAGCSEDGPAENAGEKIDEAVEKAGDAVEEAGDEAEDATD